MEEKPIFKSDLTSNLHQKLDPIKIQDSQAAMLKQGNERPDIPKQKAKNENNIFSDQAVARRIEDDKTFSKPKTVTRAEKFAAAAAPAPPESKAQKHQPSSSSSKVFAE